MSHLKSKFAALFAAFISLVSATVALASNYTGSFLVDDGEYYIELSIQQDSDGSVTGSLNDDGDLYSFSAKPMEDKILGAITAQGGAVQYPIMGQLDAQSGRLYLKVYTEVDAAGNVVSESGETFVFNRVQEGSFQGAPAQEQNPFAPQQGSQPGAGPFPGQPQQQQPQYNTGNSGAEEQLRQYLAGRHVLISWRDGGPIYGTYTFLNTHFCASGSYAVYASTSKKSVLGPENTNSWNIYGQWRVETRNGQVGVFYQDTQGGTEFVPIYVNADGSIFIREGVSFVPQGPAQCQ